MGKAGTLGIANEDEFKRRAPDSGAERERCGHSGLNRELPPAAQPRSIARHLELDIEPGEVEHRPRRCQDLGDGNQALAPRFGAVAQWIDGRRPPRRRVQRRPTCGDDGHRRLVGMGVGQAAERSAEHEGAEPLGPGMQSRVCRRLPSVRRPSHRAQTLVVLDMRPGDRADHRQAVVLVRQDVGRQQPATTLAGPATDQRHGKHAALGDQLTAAIVDQQDHRSRDARPQNRQRGPRQPCGHRRVEASPFNNAASQVSWVAAIAIGMAQ